MKQVSAWLADVSEQGRQAGGNHQRQCKGHAQLHAQIGAAASDIEQGGAEHEQGSGVIKGLPCLERGPLRGITTTTSAITTRRLGAMLRVIRLGLLGA